MSDAESSAWQCLADACLEHDLDHERRAWAELARLRASAVPVQRAEGCPSQMNAAHS